MGAREDRVREHALRATANRQFGLLRYADLTAAQLTRNEIGGRLEAGRLTRLHHCVYAFGHSALRDEGRWLAALWACGPDTALSHVSAAAYHRWEGEHADAPVHVSTTRSIKSRSGIVVHRVRHLDRADLFRPHPFAVTTAPRTLLDLADVLDWAAFRALADSRPSLHLDKLREVQRRNPGRRGAPVVRRLMEADDAHTKSEFERRFLRFLHAYGIPRPDRLNVRVGGHKVDCVYDGVRLVVELDGRAFHRRRSQMRADRARDIDLQLAGHQIARLVWDDLHPSEAARTSDRIGRLLGVR